MPDDELERELRQAAELLDPVPAGLLRAAVAAFTWRTVDAELAQLVFDSLDSAAVRGPQRSRLFVFEAGELTVEVEVTGDGGERTVLGRLAPAQVADVECRCGDRQIATTADELGRFALTLPPTGPFRLLCRPAGDGVSAPVVTEWVSS